MRTEAEVEDAWGHQRLEEAKGPAPRASRGSVALPAMGLLDSKAGRRDSCDFKPLFPLTLNKTQGKKCVSLWTQKAMGSV